MNGKRIISILLTRYYTNAFRSLFLLAFFTFNLLLFTNSYATGTYDDGAGSAEFPFEIANVAQLLELSQHSEDWGLCFILTADINLTGHITTALIAPDTDNSTINFQGVTFTGVFNGKGHTISNLTINTAGASNDYLGLFGQLGKLNEGNTEITNLGLENVIIIGGDDSDLLGGLCGKIYGSISNCYTTGSVTGGDNSGGLGGLCGSNYDGNISNCQSSVSITGGNDSRSLGGLCGSSRFGSINNCYATGPVSGGNQSVGIGGLCGVNISPVSNCYATGPVSGGDDSFAIGGLCGDAFYSISNCYATGSVTGGEDSNGLGGLCGDIQNAIVSYCYSTGSVSGGAGSENLGGLCGLCYFSSGGISDCYFLITAGPDDLYATPLTYNQMKQKGSFVGWDFVGDASGDSDDWRMCVDGIEYPKLYWQFHFSDFTCPDGVEIYDLWYLTTQWLYEGSTLRCDIAPTPSGDGVVNFFDYAEFAKYWLEGEE